MRPGQISVVLRNFSRTSPGFMTIIMDYICAIENSIIQAGIESWLIHLSLNRVFEYVHAREIKKVKDDGTWTSAQLETIVHPNEYFKRSYLLRNLGKAPVTAAEGDVAVKGETMEE
jgi:hypothetical protein